MVVFSLRHFAWIFHNHSSFQMGKQHLSKDNHGLIVDHLKSDSFRPNFRLTEERTVNTFCPVDFPPLDYEVARANIESSAGKVQSQMGFDVSFFIWVTFECFFGGLECVGKEMIKKTLWPKTREVWRWNSLEFCCCGLTFHVPIQQRNAAPVDGLKIRRFQVVWDEQKSFGCCRTTLSTIPFWMLKSLVV